MRFAGDLHCQRAFQHVNELAAIVLVAVRGLINIPEMRHVWRTSRYEFVVSMVAFAAVLLLGIGAAWANETPPPSDPPQASESPTATPAPSEKSFMAGLDAMASASDERRSRRDQR